MSLEKTPAAGKAELPELGYYTDANGYAWQLSAADAKRAGFTAPDPAPAATPALKPAPPAPDA